LIYYKVAKGDCCYDIWTSFRISQELFTSWNPSLTWPDCNIFPDQMLCVQQGPEGSAITMTTLPTTQHSRPIWLLPQFQ
jgi:hypothetical protein